MTIEIKKPLEIGKIKDLLEKNEKVLFILNDGGFDRDYIISLQKEFSNHVVSEIKWMNRLIITPSISTKTVLENLNQFYKSIELFDKTAHSLMNLIAETFDINLNNSNEIYNLKRNRTNKQKGQINDEWKYHFHGKACSFTNLKTKQFLDVQITNGFEYGQLDTYYLMKFIQTTDSLKELSLILNDDSSNMRKVIEILWMNDYLTKLPNGINNELIINRDKKPRTKQ